MILQKNFKTFLRFSDTVLIIVSVIHVTIEFYILESGEILVLFCQRQKVFKFHICHMLI